MSKPVSLETKTRIVCDGCGTFIEGKLAHLATETWRSKSDAINKAKAEGWLTVERAYRRDVHYCRQCADTPQKPILSPARKKKCQPCRDKTKADNTDTRYKVNMGYSRCDVCGWKRIHWKYK